MNKKALALILGGAFVTPAFGQSNVTISGLAAISYNNHKVSNTTRPATTENRLDDNSSRFILRGNEDLGNGLSAYFQIENRISLDTRPNSTFGNAQGLADGESFVGIKAKSWGQIGFGKFVMHYNEGLALERYRAQQTQLQVGQNLLSEFWTGGKVAGGSRSQNAIKYDTPTWGGFSAKAVYSFSPFGNEGTLTNTGANGGVSNQYGGTFAPATNSDYNDGYAWNVAANYKNGPISALLSYYEFKPENGQRANGQESWRGGFDYTFPFGLAVGVALDRSKLLGANGGADASRTAWMIPISYMTGPHGIYLTYGKANSRSGLSDSGAHQYSLAYDYAFSKRTFIGASYLTLKNDRNARYQAWNAGSTTQGGSDFQANGEDVRIFSINVTHRF